MEDTSMFTSEPIPGVQSPFFVGDRYVSDAETARRARLDLGIYTDAEWSTRAERGLAMSQTFAIERQGNAWVVPSQSVATSYRVTMVDGSLRCTCADHRNRGVACKHMFAAAFTVLGRTPSRDVAA